MTSGRRKKIVIAGVVLLCVAGLFAVAQIYASYTDRNERAIYTGTYVLGEQVSDDCLYVAVGEPTSEKKRPVVIYRQNDEKNVREGFGKIKDNKLVVASAELTIEGTGEQVTIHYGGENYPGKKLTTFRILSITEKQRLRSTSTTNRMKNKNSAGVRLAEFFVP